MKSNYKILSGLFIVLLISMLFPGPAKAEFLFKGREIHLNNDEYNVFRIGITGTTAGHNYIALIENAREESIALGEMGYWELVEDPPSYLRNHDLQMLVENNHQGNFQIELRYNKKAKNLEYEKKEGNIKISLDMSGYYPKLVIESIASVTQIIEEAMGKDSKNLMIFFDFNSFDVDLRKYYGSIKNLINKTGSNNYFYYYESDDYNSYYFKTFKNVGELDTDKMGLSLEDGTLPYYQKILDNLKSLYGTDFAKQVIIISRFGSKFDKDVKRYSREIGLGENMDVILWSYDQLKDSK